MNTFSNCLVKEMQIRVTMGYYFSLKKMILCIFTCFWKHYSLLKKSGNMFLFYFILYFIFFLLCFVLLGPKAYGGSQARGLIRATAAGQCQSYSNAGSEPRLRPTPQLTAMPDPNPLSKAKDRTHNLMVPNWIYFCCATKGTPGNIF